MMKKDILISRNKLIEAFKKFRTAHNGEHSMFATVTLPDLDKMIKAATPEKKVEKDKEIVEDFT